MLFNPVGGGVFANFQTNASGRPAVPQGTAVTPGTGAYGSWAQMVASTTDDTYGILICANNWAVSAASRNGLFQIGVDPAGGTSYTVVIPSLIAGNSSVYNDRGGGLWYYFPLFMPAGSSIAAQARGTVTGNFSVYIQLFQRPANPFARQVYYVEALGASGDGGTSLTPGSTSDGSWVSMGTTAQPLNWWQFGFQILSSDTSHGTAAVHFDVAYGDGTNFVPIITDGMWLSSSGETGNGLTQAVGCEMLVPAGSTIYMRAQNSGTAEPGTAIAYGAA